eukprot:2093894-Pyramimonas_sp.AAC.1
MTDLANELVLRRYCHQRRGRIGNSALDAASDDPDHHHEGCEPKENHYGLPREIAHPIQSTPKPAARASWAHKSESKVSLELRFISNSFLDLASPPLLSMSLSVSIVINDARSLAA